MKILDRDVSSPHKPVLIKVIETKVPDEYANANWKLVKIKEVPIPQPPLIKKQSTLPIL